MFISQEVGLSRPHMNLAEVGIGDDQTRRDAALVFADGDQITAY